MDFAECLANERPPWAVYRGLMSGRLISLDKHPGLWPVGVGGTWRRMMAKFVLKVEGQEVKQACGTEHICRWMEAGIEWSISMMSLLWQKHAHEEYWILLIIDA